jgi:hypothetical protein
LASIFLICATNLVFAQDELASRLLSSQSAVPAIFSDIKSPAVESGAESKIDSPASQASALRLLDPQRQAQTAPTKPPRRLNLSGDWRLRTEVWDWFTPATGNNNYGFVHSLLRAGIGQNKSKYDWLLEGAQDVILGLPADALAPGAQGQLGFGGTYFAANNNHRNNASAFIKQAYLRLLLPHDSNLTLGRYGFADGLELRPSDPTLSQLVNTRISQRLIGEFNFSAVLRSFDGARLAFDTETTNLTLLAVRPTEGAFQVHAMSELNIDLLYGAYSVQPHSAHSDGLFRVFAAAYFDERHSTLKIDNRPLALRSTDLNPVRIRTYGASYAHVVHNYPAGQLNFLLWGAVQTGDWGIDIHRASAFAAEVGWQPTIFNLNPWLSAGYSFGSGDSNPTDGRHATFFQILPTTRLYARFPFYNMQNNNDFYGTAIFRLPHSLNLRSELHSLHLANAQDLWYSGAGAFQPRTFGFSGRLSADQRSLASVWDMSADVPLPYGFSLTAYYAHAWGKAVIANIYPAGANAQMGYLETNFRF